MQALSEYKLLGIRLQENRVRSIDLCRKWCIRDADSTKEMHKAPETCLTLFLWCSQNTGFAILRGKQSATAEYYQLGWLSLPFRNTAAIPSSCQYMFLLKGLIFI